MILRMGAIALVAFAALHFIIATMRFSETEEHSTSDGFEIHHTIVMPHATLATGLAGIVLFGLSFLHLPKCG